MKKVRKGKGLFSPRNDFNNTSRRTLDELGSGRVVGVVLSRAPIKGFLRKTLNVLSLGKFEEAMKRYGHDRLFHLSMIVDVDVGGVVRKVVLEKNAVVSISSRIVNEPDAEYLRIDGVPDITLLQMVDSTRNLMGNNFFPYNHINNNCQVFIDDILKANGMWSEQAHKWLFQDVSGLANDLHPITNTIAKFATDTASVVDKLVGNGMKPTPLEMLVNEIIEEISNGKV